MRAIVERLPMRDPADMSALKAAFATGRLDPASIVAILGKTEGNGCVNDFTRGYAIMRDDSDINATRHARALVGGVLAGAVGDTRLFVSGGAEHQGPDGGGPVAVIARV